MQSRYFTLASSWLAVVAAATFALGQEPSSASQVGYVRFWSMLPPESGTFDLRKSGGNPSEANLFKNVPSYRYSSYRELAAGKYNVAVYKSTEEKTPIKTFSIDLKPNSYFTVLISPEGGVISTQLINDTINPNTPGASLTVRNYFPGMTVDVVAGPESIVGGLAYGRSAVVNDLPLKKLPLTLRSRLANGTPVESGAEADFFISKRATLLIIPDGYGRFRPRVTVDGKNL